MRVRMRATLSGTRDGVDWPKRGGTVDLPADEAAHLIAAGLAEPDGGAEPAEEHATAPDTAAKAVPKPAGRKPSARK